MAEEAAPTGSPAADTASPTVGRASWMAVMAYITLVLAGSTLMLFFGTQPANQLVLALAQATPLVAVLVVILAFSHRRAGLIRLGLHRLGAGGGTAGHCCSRSLRSW